MTQCICAQFSSPDPECPKCYPKKGDILKFVPRRPLEVFQCDCGRQDVYLCVDGSIECRGCGIIHSHRRHYHIAEAKLVKLDG